MAEPLLREDRPQDVHVMPNLPQGHPRAHASSVLCWCEPEVTFVAERDGFVEAQGRVWTHKEVH